MIAIVGVSHRTAPLAVREVLAFPRERVRETLHALRAETGAAEAVVLSTCNRVEIGAEGASAESLLAFLASSHGRDGAEVEPHAYVIEGIDAVRHALRVASSLDSMVVGEAQILGQVKEAYQAAAQAGTLGPALTALRDRSLAAAKRVRSATSIGENAVSVSHVAVELARKIFGDLAGRRVLLVGAGKMSELAARRLVKDGASATVVGGRTFERAEALARALDARAVPLAALGDEMARADIVISGTGAPGLVIRREDVARAAGSRRGRPLFLIDIAVPRDVEASAREVDGVFLYDLDDLQTVSRSNLRERRREAEKAEAIVEGEVRAYLAWERSREVVPLLVELRRRGEEVRRAEVEKLLRKLGPLTPEQEQAVEAVTTAIVNKLLHPPTVHLKEAAAREDASALVGLIQRVLGLERPLALAPRGR